MLRVPFDCYSDAAIYDARPHGSLPDAVNASTAFHPHRPLAPIIQKQTPWQFVVKGESARKQKNAGHHEGTRR
jgi:hypothetical protein